MISLLIIDMILLVVLLAVFYFSSVIVEEVGGLAEAVGITSFWRFRYYTDGNFSLISAWNHKIFSIGLFSRVKSIKEGKVSGFIVSNVEILLWDRYSFYRLLRLLMSFICEILFFLRLSSTSDFKPDKFSMTSIWLFERLRTLSE